MKIQGSIYRRLMLQLVGGAAVLAAIMFVLFQSFARQLAIESQDTTLLASATSILESVSIQRGEVTADIPYAALAMLGNVSDDRVFYQITQGRAVLTGYEDLPRYAASELPSDPASWTADYRGDQIRLVSVSNSLPFNGVLTPITVTVAQTQDGLAQKLTQISRRAILIGAVFFVVATGLSIWTARSSVRPLNTLAAAVSRRGPEDLRPVSAPVPSEMAPLVASLNAFIARLERSLSRSEEFIVEAAHRVRTPLATVRTQAEITLRRVDREENRVALKKLIRAVDESSRAAGQLLDHAMVAFRTDHMEQTQVDLSAAVAEVIDRQRPVADLRDIAFKRRIAPGCTVFGDSILIHNAVTNILDNAVKYSAPETTVSIEVTQADGVVQVAIRDQGPGFGDADTETLTQRFARGANAGQTVGSGLGLTIAAEVARAHNGRLTLGNNPQEVGACVTLSLPS